MNESMVIAETITRVSRDWEREHVETNGEHYGMTGPGTSAGLHCPICAPPRPLSDFEREEIASEIEFDLL